MDAATLSEAMGHSPGVDYARLVGPFTEAMLAADCRTPSRAAMWCAQIGHESGGLRWMEEIADGSAYNGRADLGNIYPGDGPRFKGSGPIQLTGRANFRAFTAWCRENRHSDIDFEARPELVRDDPHWGFLAATFYWSTHPIINTCADNGWIWDATRAINGGTNGIDDRIARWNRCRAMGGRLLGTHTEGVSPVEKVLDYSRAEIRQDTYYWCGPASAQTLINARTGQMVPEGTLATELGTTVNGTDWIGQIAGVLNRRIGGGYQVVELPDPPSPAQVNALWDHVVRAVDAGFGVSMNFVAPPGNYPRGTHGSVSPQYGGGMVYHYTACMGYARDGNGSRHLWIADSGFPPYGYWASLEQIASIIGGKGYAWPAATPTREEDDMTPEQDRMLREVHRELTQRYPSRSGYRVDDRPIDTLAGLILNVDARIHETWVETKAKAEGVTPQTIAQRLRDLVKGGNR